MDWSSSWIDAAGQDGRCRGRFHIFVQARVLGLHRIFGPASLLLPVLLSGQDAADEGIGHRGEAVAVAPAGGWRRFASAGVVTPRQVHRHIHQGLDLIVIHQEVVHNLDAVIAIPPGMGGMTMLTVAQACK
jgi:hypothetical protein